MQQQYSLPNVHVRAASCFAMPQLLALVTTTVRFSFAIAGCRHGCWAGESTLVLAACWPISPGVTQNTPISTDIVIIMAASTLLHSQVSASKAVWSGALPAGLRKQHATNSINCLWCRSLLRQCENTPVRWQHICSMFA